MRQEIGGTQTALLLPLQRMPEEVQDHQCSERSQDRQTGAARSRTWESDEQTVQVELLDDVASASLAEQGTGDSAKVHSCR